ncbi:hypothetical protein [Luteolibacter pohnpeiensis]|nr:hypothetical protein [Luteolibacter pohnpeiensis]
MGSIDRSFDGGMMAENGFRGSTNRNIGLIHLNETFVRQIF